MMDIKFKLCSLLGMLGAMIANLFGGWDAALQTLVICMAVDYLTGLVVAAVFKKSTKTETGALQSNAGWKGLCKKGMTLLVVLVAVRLDISLGTSFIRNVAIIGYIVNEAISITENAGLMGVPVHPAIIKAIDVLKQKEGGNNE
jgi:toxin secretion/phage lysis holin